MNKSKLKPSNRLIIKGLQTLSGFGRNFYTTQKNQAKTKAELTFIGEKKMENIQNQMYGYNVTGYFLKEQIKDIGELKTSKTDDNFWLNYHGIHDAKLIEEVGQQLNIDRLVIRQILDTTLRPKVEEDRDYLTLNIKSILKKEPDTLHMEQISFILGENFVISFQEEKGDHFQSIRHRITENVGFIRKRTSDYLLVQLLDAILDNYFETIEIVNQEISVLEKTLLKEPDERTIFELEAHKRSAQLIKKALGPFREVIQNIVNTETPLLRKENIRYYKDLANSSTSAMDEIESTLKTLEGLANIYFASLSHKMNEIMKMLTLVATIFIPLTFIAGIYGMNFEYMPELKYRYGYFIIWGVILSVSVLMIIFFRRKRWI